MDAIGFVIGVATWFMVIMPAIVHFATAANNPLWEEHIREKMKGIWKMSDGKPK